MKVPETPNGVLRLFEPFILLNGDSFTNLSQTQSEGLLGKSRRKEVYSRVFSVLIFVAVKSYLDAPPIPKMVDPRLQGTSPGDEGPRKERADFSIPLLGCQDNRRCCVHCSGSDPDIDIRP